MHVLAIEMGSVFIHLPKKDMRCFGRDLTFRQGPGLIKICPVKVVAFC